MCLPLTTYAQQLFTANESPTAEKLLSPRPLQYWVDSQGAITCIDGQNRFTRALYGSCVDGRLETSDLPEFGLYMPYMGGNVKFILPEGARCTSQYMGYGRTYRIDHLPEEMCLEGQADHAWIRIVALAINLDNSDSQGGVWRIECAGIKPSSVLKVRYGGANNASFSRNGDLGVDKKDCFDFKQANCAGNEYSFLSPTHDASARFSLTYGQKSKRGERTLQGAVWSGTMELVNEEEPYLMIDINLLNLHPASPNFLVIGRYDNTKPPAAVWQESGDRAFKASRTIKLTLPDQTMQPLGYVLSTATDAIWDEPSGVWQHGAIGWRMPLPGWRAGYVGDVMGLHERTERHFSGYAASQLVDVDVNPDIPLLDPSKHLARSTEKIGAPMYTTGYIGRYPNNPTKINHYDMNLVYIDELLWHLNWTGDWEMAERYFPVIERHLAWEKRCFDPDGDHLYDAYCCIWASDGLYYDGGAVTHSSAYNYRANAIAAKIAQGLAERTQDAAAKARYHALAQQYQDEATGIYHAIDQRLWMSDRGVWAEFQDKLGHQRQHTSPALWTIYHAVDSEVGTKEQRYYATQYVDLQIPHYRITVDDAHAAPDAISLINDINAGGYYAISTTNWQPYGWSINNVALAEEMHTALAYWQAGRPDDAYHLFKGALLDCMYLGAAPGNLAQISFYDAARGECYRDFGDPVGITARTLVQGLFGVQPDLLNNRVVLRPGFPKSWIGKEVALSTADFNYGRHADGSYFFEGHGRFADADIVWDTVAFVPKPFTPVAKEQVEYTTPVLSQWPEMKEGKFVDSNLDLSSYYNLPVAELFAQEYVSPRSQTITLSMPTQGIGEWCHPLDSFAIAPDLGLKAVFTSLFDNFPNKVTIPVNSKKGITASRVYLNMCGTTNAMQSHIANGVVRFHYTTGAPDSLVLINPVNWWPIEQELVNGLPAFSLSTDEAITHQAPLRMSLKTGEVYQPKADELNKKTKGGATMLLDALLDNKRKLKSIEIETLSNDVIIGLIDAYIKP